jgi:hypothetical protein
VSESILEGNSKMISTHSFCPTVAISLSMVAVPLSCGYAGLEVVIDVDLGNLPRLDIGDVEVPGLRAEAGPARRALAGNREAGRRAPETPAVTPPEKSAKLTPSPASVARIAFLPLMTVLLNGRRRPLAGVTAVKFWERHCI